MLIIYKEISVLVRTVTGRPEYVEVESSELDFLNKFELLRALPSKVQILHPPPEGAHKNELVHLATY